MSAPKRIQRMRTKGWRMPEGVVYVGRPSRWGNPFSIEQIKGWPRWASSAPWQVVWANGHISHPEDDRKPIVGREAANAHARHLAAQTAVDLFALHIGPMGNHEYDDDTLARLRKELAGRDLACWCPLDQPCHADVLLELANEATS